MKRTPLRRITPLNRLAPISQVSRKRAVTNIERGRMMREAFGPRENWKCSWLDHVVKAEMMGFLDDAQFSRLIAVKCHGSVHGHELRKRSQGGSVTDPANVVLLCNLHNGWVEDFPALAERVGLVVHAWQ